VTTNKTVRVGREVDGRRNGDVLSPARVRQAMTFRRATRDFGTSHDASTSRLTLRIRLNTCRSTREFRPDRDVRFDPSSASPAIESDGSVRWWAAVRCLQVLDARLR
jgi:hypothetical protein